MNGIAHDCKRRKVLGENVKIKVHAIDETNRRVSPENWICRITQGNARGVVALVGVQSNQFPRAMDLARRFRDKGLPVCIGGFHAAGVLSMLPEPTPEIRSAQAMGISQYVGEAEQGRFDRVLQDAYAGELKSIYDHLDAMPDLDAQPLPFLPPRVVKRTLSGYSSFNLGRGCPFSCSFCTIKNVQRQKSRFRSADDLEAIIRTNHEHGIHKFFLTDDNLARNGNWEACLDRLIELRQKESIGVRLAVQVDATCHTIPRFIEKAVAAGVDNIFIGIESMNPEYLNTVRKRHNKVAKALMRRYMMFFVVLIIATGGGLPFSPHRPRITATT